MSTAASGEGRAPSTGYRFAPRPTRGLLLGLQASQLVLVAVGLAALVFGLSRGLAGALIGVVIAAACIGLVAAPVTGGGRLDLWLLLFVRQVSRLRAQTRVGEVTAHDCLQLPPPLDGLELRAVALPDGGEAGVLVDKAAGRYTALLAVSGSSFTLRDADDQHRRVAGWGRALASIGREGSPLRRIQWVTRAVPDSGNALLAHWAAAGRPDAGVAATSYQQLIRGAGPITQSHEVVIAACLEASRARRAIRQAGGTSAAPLVLLAELSRLADQLAAAEVHVEGVVPPRGVARLLRTAYDPAAQTSIDRRPVATQGVAAIAAGPVVVEPQWDCYRSDSGWHTTYWIAEWPRLTVGPDFLAPLLLAADVRHSVSLIAEPMSAATATRKLSSARTAEAANASLRSRVGQLDSERNRVEADEVDRRERDLVAGHAVCRFAAFVTVTATTREALIDACGRIEHAATSAHLELHLLYGQQDRAFVRTLPLAYPPC